MARHGETSRVGQRGAVATGASAAIAEANPRADLERCVAIGDPLNQIVADVRERGDIVAQGVEGRWEEFAGGGAFFRGAVIQVEHNLLLERKISVTNQ